MVNVIWVDSDRLGNLDAGNMADGENTRWHTYTRLTAKVFKLLENDRRSPDTAGLRLQRHLLQHRSR
jgi:hypothetical protein